MESIGKITTLEELDEILSLIDKFHNENDYWKLFTKIGFLTDIVGNLINPDWSFWIIKNNDDKTIGYCIVMIVTKHFIREAVIFDTYMIENNPELSHKSFEIIEKWAKDLNCKYISCYTVRGEAISKSYGFNIKQEYLLKKIGG